METLVYRCFPTMISSYIPYIRLLSKSAGMFFLRQQRVCTSLRGFRRGFKVGFKAWNPWFGTRTQLYLGAPK